MEEYGSENNIEWLKGDKTATVFLSGNTKLCHKVEKYARDFPNEVEIEGRNADGSIVAHIPTSYIKITRPAERHLTEEQKDRLRERLREIRKK